MILWILFGCLIILAYLCKRFGVVHFLISIYREKSINVFICSKEYECKDKIGVGCSFSLVFLGFVYRSTRGGTQIYRR